MEVILLESLDKLGTVGDVVKVKNGFARNFLIPQKKALRANKENKDYYQKIKNELLEKNKKIINDANDIVKKISDKEIIFIRNASDNGQLYGSVSPKDISNYFSEKKIDIKPSCINLHSAIKKVGFFEINIKLHADVVCLLKLNVATSEENAKKQKQDLINKKKDDLSQSKDKNSPEKEKKVEELKNVSLKSKDINSTENKKNAETEKKITKNIKNNNLNTDKDITKQTVEEKSGSKKVTSEDADKENLDNGSTEATKKTET
ncbi:MAG: 50S ribosomal protein L9 [Rickettsiales bacterium]|nr:50S ribosomal protein L9 [Rickettsiales bacterium]|tara:strand:+ start:43 stop:828 length:786 start_codon:yes stop_codon:yes gene_type:complete